MNRMTTEKMAYEFWLAGVTGVSSARKKKIRALFGSGKELYENLYYIEETKFREEKCITLEEIQILKSESGNKDVIGEYEQFLKEGYQFIPYFSAAYPERLKMHKGMPYALYANGALPDDEKPTVAIIGARNCTRYGEKQAMEYAQALAVHGVQIISGMARGIDGVSQRAALQAGGASFGVLGSGVDLCYPKENKGLYADLPRHGGILSEYQNGTPPLREHFPARNRIISALADVVIVMEAKKRSGSLITCDFALEQGKDVYALPGPVDSVLSRGCHELIRQGAGILISPEILLEEMHISCIKNNQKNNKDLSKNEKVLESDEVLVYACVGLFPKSLDEIIKESGKSAEIVMRNLFSLQIKGYVKELAKNNYVRI